MTLRMLDSIIPANLPAGADAYLGYADGAWPTYSEIIRLFPHAHHLSLTVSPALGAMGCDREPGDLSAAQMVTWVKASLAAKVWRPVCYAAASNMNACYVALRLAGVQRGSVRLLSAHYGAGRHICSPASCGLVSVAMDGTQWSGSAEGNHGSVIDESVLLDDFFGAPAPPVSPAPVLEADMIIVTVLRDPLPAGVKWPGVFLFTSMATWEHIETQAKLDALRSLGLPQKNMSYANFALLGGAAAVPE
jgi:hypothetical protein